MSARIRIAVDAMSGDLGPRVAISAAENFVAIHPDVDLMFVGDRSKLQSLLEKSSSLLRKSARVLHAADVVSMDDDPLSALRQKKSSSMWVALECLRADEVDACVSAGNTGALLAMARYLIKTFPEIDRPAICKSMPVTNGVTYLLDLGANINCSPLHLQQFALMGAVLAEVSGVVAPRVALLNIGSEAQKGTEVLRQAQELLRNDSRINYVGFVESSEIFTGNDHVIVCDGFHGNVALKASEGLARFVAKKISTTLRRNFFNKILSLIAAPMLTQLSNELNPSLYNGASFLGLRKTLIKSHGSADAKAFMQALVVAREQVLLRVPEKIARQLGAGN